jgi:hypothetical protein
MAAIIRRHSPRLRIQGNPCSRCCVQKQPFRLGMSKTIFIAKRAFIDITGHVRSQEKVFPASLHGKTVYSKSKDCYCLLSSFFIVIQVSLILLHLMMVLTLGRLYIINAEALARGSHSLNEEALRVFGEDRVSSHGARLGIR